MAYRFEEDECLLEKAKRIRYLLLDVDGVMTNGLLMFDEDGREMKAFSVHDGLGVTLFRRAGLGVGIISGRTSPVVALRAKELQIDDLIQGSRDKLLDYDEIKKKRQLDDIAVAFVGDDLIDIPLLKKVGFSIAVANAVDPVKKIVDMITERKGGEGAVREVIDFILTAQKANA